MVLRWILGDIAESDYAYCDTCYHSVVYLSVCVSFVTLVHAAKAEWDAIWQGHSFGPK